MKVAFIANTSWNIYNFRIALISALLEKKHQIFVIAPYDEFTEKLREIGCECMDVKMENKGSNPFSDLRYMFSLYKILQKIRPAVALQYTIKCNIYGTLASHLLKVPVINNVSGLGTVFLHNNLTTRIAKLLYKFAFKFPKVVFFQNHEDKQLFIKLGLVDQKICDLLPGSGVDLKKFSAQSFVDNTPFQFIMVARLLFDKGVQEYAASARLILQTRKDVAFHLVGAPDYKSGLGIPKIKLDNWIAEGILIYHPFTTDVKELMKSKNCIVLPSYREGTAKTLLEALALAKPIITTNVPGCKETVIEGENGFLCEPGNIESLANAMNKMLDLTYLQHCTMSQKSRELAEAKFDQEIVVEKYVLAIKNTLKLSDF